MNLTARDINKGGIFYHVSPLLLENGSIIKKGNWGRVLKMYIGTDCHGLNLFRERILEDIRINRFKNKPSRLNCSYVLRDEVSARFYKDKQSDLRTSCIYKVQAINLDCNIHIGNWNRVLLKDQYHYDNMDQCAIDYWNNTYIDPQTIELLLDSDIKIIEIVQS